MVLTRSSYSRLGTPLASPLSNPNKPLSSSSTSQQQQNNSQRSTKKKRNSLQSTASSLSAETPLTPNQLKFGFELIDRLTAQQSDTPPPPPSTSNPELDSSQLYQTPAPPSRNRTNHPGDLSQTDSDLPATQPCSIIDIDLSTLDSPPPPSTTHNPYYHPNHHPLTFTQPSSSSSTLLNLSQSSSISIEPNNSFQLLQSSLPLSPIIEPTPDPLSRSQPSVEELSPLDQNTSVANMLRQSPPPPPQTQNDDQKTHQIKTIANIVINSAANPIEIDDLIEIPKSIQTPEDQIPTPQKIESAPDIEIIEKSTDQSNLTRENPSCKDQTTTDDGHAICPIPERNPGNDGEEKNHEEQVEIQNPPPDAPTDPASPPTLELTQQDPSPRLDLLHAGGSAQSIAHTIETDHPLHPDIPSSAASSNLNPDLISQDPSDPKDSSNPKESSNSKDLSNPKDSEDSEDEVDTHENHKTSSESSPDTSETSEDEEEEEEDLKVLELLKRAKEKARLLDSKTTPTPTTTGVSLTSTSQEDGGSDCGSSVTLQNMIRLEEEEEAGAAGHLKAAGLHRPLRSATLPRPSSSSSLNPSKKENRAVPVPDNLERVQKLKEHSLGLSSSFGNKKDGPAKLQWHDLPTQPLTRETKLEIQAMRLHRTLDPKKFIKGGIEKALKEPIPEKFLFGHLVDGSSSSSSATPAHHSSSTKKRSFVDSLVSDQHGLGWIKNQYDGLQKSKFSNNNFNRSKKFKR